MMNKKQVFNEYCKYFDELRQNSLAFSNFLARQYAVDGFEIENGHVAIGATRATIIKDDSEWVVKIGIDTDEDNMDACEHECEVYDAAKVYGLQEYFSEAMYLGNYRATVEWYDYSCNYDYNLSNDEIMHLVEEDECKLLTTEVCIPLYGYRKANCYSYLIEPQCTNDERRYVKTYRSPIAERSEKVGLLFLIHYGKDIYARLSELLNEYHVNDLHTGNIGFINEKPVFIDYAGYNCNYS